VCGYVCVCLSGFNIGSASTTGTQSSSTAGAAPSSAAGTVAVGAGAGPAAGSGKSASSTFRREVNQDVCNVPGFTVLQWLLSQHPHIPHVYFMMMALLVGQPVQQLPPDVQVSLCWLVSLGVALNSSSRAWFSKLRKIFPKFVVRFS